MHNLIELPRSVDPLHIHSDKIKAITESDFHDTDDDKLINEQFRKDFFWAISSTNIPIVSTKNNITNKEIYTMFKNRKIFFSL